MKLPRSEAERTLEALGQRGRLAIAVAVAGFVVLFRQADAAPEDLLARGFIVAFAFFVAVLAHELPTRASSTLGVAAGLLADLAAAAIAVDLIVDELQLAPVALLWPIFTAGLVVSTLYVLGVASLTTVVLAGIMLSRGASVDALTFAAGWGAVYFATAFAYAELLRQFRRAQRSTEAALSHAAGLAHCSSPEEVGEELFEFIDTMLGLQGAPAALLHDERASGTHAVVAARGLDAEARSRIRLTEGADALDLIQDGGVWTEPRLLAERLSLSGALKETQRLFVVPLRDHRRVIGVLLVGSRRERHLHEEAQRGIARVAAQAASALQRVRVSRLLTQQRAAMSFLLDARRAGDDVGAIAAWAARAARDFTDAADAIYVVRQRPTYRPVANVSGDAEPVVADALLLLDAMFERQLPVVVPDASGDDRFHLGKTLRRGSIVAVPVRGEGSALLVRHDRPDAITSAAVELLIMLADQAALLLTRAHALGRAGSRPVGDRRMAESRVAELAAHFHDPNAELEARIVEALRLAIEGNQPYLAGSGGRVARIALSISEGLEVRSHDRDALYVAALLRDVGQLGVDRSILERPTSLTLEELGMMRQHPLLGETILASLGFLAPAARVVRAHHERFDGSGYPDGGRGPDIPLGARILAVADAFDALTSERPHRLAFPAPDAVRTIVESAGHAFDPDVVECFAALVGTGEGAPSSER